MLTYTPISFDFAEHYTETGIANLDWDKSEQQQPLSQTFEDEPIFYDLTDENVSHPPTYRIHPCKKNLQMYHATTIYIDSSVYYNPKYLFYNDNSRLIQEDKAFLFRKSKPKNTDYYKIGTRNNRDERIRAISIGACINIKRDDYRKAIFPIQVNSWAYSNWLKTKQGDKPNFSSQKYFSSVFLNRKPTYFPKGIIRLIDEFAGGKMFEPIQFKNPRLFDVGKIVNLYTDSDGIYYRVIKKKKLRIINYHYSYIKSKESQITLEWVRSDSHYQRHFPKLNKNNKASTITTNITENMVLCYNNIEPYDKEPQHINIEYFWTNLKHSSIKRTSQEKGSPLNLEFQNKHYINEWENKKRKKYANKIKS